MKKILENYCEECKRKTIWNLKSFKVLDLGRYINVSMYKCEGCNLYSTVNYLRTMNKKGR